MSYLVPTNELTLSDIRQYRAAAVEAVILRALALGLARTREELVVRTGLPLTDFGTALTGWQIESYNGPAIAGAGWGSPFQFGALPGSAPVLANSKVAIFFGFADWTAVPQVTAIRFRIGPTGATTKATFFLQLETGAKIEPDVYFTEPIIYDPQDTVYIEFYYAALQAAGGELFAFKTFVVERLGANIS